MQVERVGSAVCVYDCYLDDSSHGEDIGVAVFAVYLGVVHEVGGSGEGGVKGWYLELGY